MILNILFAVASIVFCIVAPSGCDVRFCWTLAWVYIAQNILFVLLDDKKNKWGFTLFFCISFFFCNFAYPLFYYTERPDYSFFNISFPTDVINRSTAIAYMGYAFFMLGQTRFFRMRREEPDPPRFKVGMNQYLFFFIAALSAFAGYLFFGGWQALQNVYSGNGNLRDVGIYSYFNNIFTLSAYLMAIFVFRIDKRYRWFYVLVLLCSMGIIVSTGSRSLTLGLLLIIFVGFNNNIRRFRWSEMLVLMVIGVFGMFLVMTVRKMQVGDSWMNALANLHIQNPVDIFKDLTINCRNLYVLTDFGETHPNTWFHGMLVDVCSPIPGMTGWLVNHFQEPVELLHGGDLPTYLTFGANMSWGLGTNMIGEAFRSFGYAGVAVAMWLIGQIVKDSYYASSHNVYAYTIYYLFVSHAVIYPRAPLLFDPRTIVWTLLMVWIVQTLTTNPQCRVWGQKILVRLQQLSDRKQ